MRRDEAPIVIGGGWALWPDASVRGAGFPAEWLLRLGDEGLAACFDDEAVSGEERAAALRDFRARARVAICEAARDPRLREALTWQNRQALRMGIHSLLRHPDATNSQARQQEQLVAMYLQRYCAKNDTAGFFGPACAARVGDAAGVLRTRPGPALVSRRAACLEAWAVHALADKLSEDPALRRELAPRPMPNVRLDGRRVMYGTGRASELDAAFAATLSACDGRTPARNLAEALAGDDTLGLEGLDDVYELLEELERARLIAWRLQVPTAGGEPDTLLRAELERLRPSEARDRAFAALDELERGRAGVAQAAGDAVALDGAIEALEITFERLTGVASRRLEGQTYAGRTIVTEDCVRDVDVELGAGLVDRLARPLGLVLASARWFTDAIARDYRAALRALFDELRGPAESVDYPRFEARLPALFPGSGAPGSIVARAAAEIADRWWRLLGARESDRCVERSAAELAPRVAEAFAAPGPGWPSARHHSPDLLVAGDPSALDRGEFELVLGEVHVGINTLLIPSLPTLFEHHTDLVARHEAEVGRPGVAPVWSRNRTRTDYHSPSPRDFDLENGPERSSRPPGQVLAAADLLVRERGGQLSVETRDGGRRFDVIAFLERHLVAESHSAFRLIGLRPHTPRVVIDGVVLARESWRVSAGEVSFAGLTDSVERFAAARRWARSIGLPRFAFVKVAHEAKPIYVDFASPLYVDLLAKQLRRAREAATFSEMLPGFDQLWLTDHEGHRFTSELRLVAVDPIAWREPTPSP